MSKKEGMVKTSNDMLGNLSLILPFVGILMIGLTKIFGNIYRTPFWEIPMELWTVGMFSSFERIIYIVMFWVMLIGGGLFLLASIPVSIVTFIKSFRENEGMMRAIISWHLISASPLILWLIFIV